MADSALFTSDRLASRNSQFLSSPAFTTSDFAVALRKSKRLENSTRKRKVPPDLLAAGTSAIGSISSSRANLVYLSSLLNGGTNSHSQYLVLKALKNIYGLGEVLAFKISMELQIIPAIILVLNDLNSDVECVKEAVWCLCNLSSGPSFVVNSLVSEGAIPVCKALLQYQDLEIIEYSIWCISNIASDCAEHRKKVLEFGFLEELIGMAEPLQFMVSTLVWTFRNLSEKGLGGKEHLVKPLLKVLKNTIVMKNEEIIQESLWVVSHISDGNCNCIQTLINNKIINNVLKYANYKNSKISLPAIRTLGNITAGTCEQTQKLLDKGLLDIFYSQFEKTSKTDVKKYILWGVSNLTAGTRSQISIVTSHPLLIQTLNSINFFDPHIQKEAITVLYNIVSLGTLPSVMALVNVGVIKQTTEFLEYSSDPEMICKVLGSLIKILKILNDTFGSEIIALMHKANIKSALEKTLMVKNAKVEKLTSCLLGFIENDKGSDFGFS